MAAGRGRRCRGGLTRAHLAATAAGVGALRRQRGGRNPARVTVTSRRTAAVDGRLPAAARALVRLLILVEPRRELAHLGAVVTARLVGDQGVGLEHGGQPFVWLAA